MVPSATADLVQHVLDEHGDPGADGATEAVSSATPEIQAQSENDGDNTAESGPTDAPGQSESESAESDTQATDADTNGVSHTPAHNTAASAVPPTPRTNPERRQVKTQLPPPIPQSPTEAADLTDRQRAVLECVAENPTAPQADIGERLGIAASTVCNRVSAIPGFEWSDQADLADAMLKPAGPEETSDGTNDNDTASVAETANTDTDDRSETTPDTPASQTVGAGDTTDIAEASTDGGTTQPADADLTETRRTTAELEARIEALTDRVGALDDRLAEQQAAEPEGVFEDPELAHKLVHAAMASDRITEDEELALLREML